MKLGDLGVGDIEEKDIADAIEDLLETPEHCRTMGMSVIGPRHVREKKPNQDSFAIGEPVFEDDPTVVALADGHGGEMYTRSETGANLATRLAVNTLEVFLQYYGERSVDALTKALKEIYVPNFISSWKTLVREDINRSPLSEHERTKLKGHADPMAYGTTILIAASTPEYEVFIQLGDGDIITVMDDGKPAVIFPRKSEEYENTLTYSLNTSSAEEVTNVLVRPRVKGKPSLTMLYTDGLSGGYFHPIIGPEMEALELLEKLNKPDGMELMETFPLRARLERAAERSRDDTSAIMMWSKPRKR